MQKSLYLLVEILYDKLRNEISFLLSIFKCTKNYE